MLTLVNTKQDENCLIKSYNCDFVVECAGDSLWGNTDGRNVRVTGITVIEEEFDGEIYTQVNVTHDSTWDIYTDTGFEDAISDALGFDVCFTEQGMQDNNLASMEC